MPCASASRADRLTSRSVSRNASRSAGIPSLMSRPHFAACSSCPAAFHRVSLSGDSRSAARARTLTGLQHPTTRNAIAISRTKEDPESFSATGRP